MSSRSASTSPSDAQKLGVAGQASCSAAATITKTLHGKSEVDFYEEYIRAIKNIATKPRITFEVNARPREEVQRYKAAGADNIHFNMEVWDKTLFRMDQSRQGRARRLGQLGALDVRRGRSVRQRHVQPSFVSGVEMARPHGFKTVEEAVNSMTSADSNILMSRGILPRPQQWRREPSTALCKEADQPPVPLDYYVLITRNWYECYQKYRSQLPEVRHAQGRGFLPNVTCSVRCMAPTATSR